MINKRFGTIPKQLLQRNNKIHPKIPNNIDIQRNFLRNLQKHPKDGGLSQFLKKLGNLHLLTQLCAREIIIELCCRESFKTYNS
jgi:hypothetical protein